MRRNRQGNNCFQSFGDQRQEKQTQTDDNLLSSTPTSHFNIPRPQLSRSQYLPSAPPSEFGNDQHVSEAPKDEDIDNKSSDADNINKLLDIDLPPSYEELYGTVSSQSSSKSNKNRNLKIKRPSHPPQSHSYCQRETCYWCLKV